MAFDSIDPIGSPRDDHRVKVGLAWLLSALTEDPMSPDAVRGISPEISEPEDEPLMDAADAGPSEADIAQAQREQAMFT